MKSWRKIKWEWELLYCIDIDTVACNGFCTDRDNSKNTTQVKLEIKNLSQKNSGAEKSLHLKKILIFFHFLPPLEDSIFFWQSRILFSFCRFFVSTAPKEPKGKAWGNCLFCLQLCTSRYAMQWYTMHIKNSFKRYRHMCTMCTAHQNYNNSYKRIVHFYIKWSWWFE